VAETDINIKQKMAQQAARLFLTQMASAPADVQLMAVGMIARIVFITGIKKERRLQLLSRWMKSLRDEVKEDLNKKVETDGKS
jgi:uncharacterized protein YejL (UPF0352 family)